MTKQELNSLYQHNAKIKYQWLDEVLSNNKIKEHGRIIAFTLVRYCGNNGKIYPTLAQLSEAIGASVMTARRGLKELIDNQHLHSIKCKRNSQYHFKSVQIDTMSVQIEHPINNINNYKDNNSNIKVIKEEDIKHLVDHGCPCSTCSADSASTEECIYD